MAEAAELLFCDQVYVDPGTGKVTLLGIFTQLRPTQFPSPFRDFVIFAMLRGDPGDSGLLRLTCMDAATEEILSQEETNQAFGIGRLTIPFVFRMGEFRFPRASWYLFRLEFAGENIAENMLYVLEVA